MLVTVAAALLFGVGGLLAAALLRRRVTTLANYAKVFIFISLFFVPVFFVLQVKLDGVPPVLVQVYLLAAVLGSAAGGFVLPRLNIQWRKRFFHCFFAGYFAAFVFSYFCGLAFGIGFVRPMLKQYAGQISYLGRWQFVLANAGNTLVFSASRHNEGEGLMLCLD